MNFTYEDFKKLIRRELLSLHTSFTLDATKLEKREVAQIIVWCERDGYGYKYDEENKVIKVEILKGFRK